MGIPHNSHLLVRVIYTGPQMGRRIIYDGSPELDIRRGPEGVILPGPEAQVLVEQFGDLQIVEQEPRSDDPPGTQGEGVELVKVTASTPTYFLVATPTVATILSKTGPGE